MTQLSGSWRSRTELSGEAKWNVALGVFTTLLEE